jgi:hypothetical protein
MMEHGLVRRVCALIVLLGLGTGLVVAQTNAKKTSAVGTWKLDVERSDFGPEPKPVSVTLTILSDTPDIVSVRVEVVADATNKMAYEWSGPRDGSLHPVKTADGQTIAQESFKYDGDVLVRHVEDSSGVFDSRATMSADGNTITDNGVQRGADGKTSNVRSVYRRVSNAK